MNNMKIDLTEAVDAAAREIARKSNINWEDLDAITQTHLRERVLVSIRAALPFVIDQVLKAVVDLNFDY